jgi:hypothetical protein
LVDYIEFIGMSGERYRYRAPEPLTTIRIAGGYALVSRGAEGPVLLFAGVTDDLAEGWREAWSIAQSQVHDLQLLVHRTISRQARDAELADILAAYDPPMNREPFAAGKFP